MGPTTTGRAARGPARVGWFDRRAALDAAPLLIAVAPFGFVLGVAYTESAMPTWVAWLTGPLIFAGAAQITVVTLAATATVWSVVAAGLVINVRHVMYSVALASRFRDQPRWFRWLAPFFLIDQTFAMTSVRPTGDPVADRRYFLTLGAVFYSAWLTLTTAGMFAGPVIPESWRLEFSIPIMFSGMVLMSIGKVPQAVAATVGGAVGLVTAGMSDRIGILIGAAAGLVAGYVAEVATERRQVPGDVSP